MSENQTALPPIEKGKHGWKVRRLEILILETMSRATQPNAGWNVYQKIRKQAPAGGDEICARMLSLADRGFLDISKVDPDPECGWFYCMPKLASRNMAGRD